LSECVYLIRNEISTVIDAPVDKVWEFLSNLDTMTQYSSNRTLKIEYTRPIGVGSTIAITTRLMGKRTLRGTITEWEPGHKFVIQSKAMGSDIKEVWSLEQVEGTKTKLTKSQQAQVGGIMRLFQSYLSSKTKEVNSAQFAKIKQIMEAKNTPGV
jgi:uncharacterized protein YndB with AHSA1/START domain